MPLNDEQEVAPVAIEEVKTETVENQPEPTPEQGEKPAKESEEPDHALKGVQKRIDRLTRQKYEAQARAEYLEKMLNERQAPKTESVIDRSQFASDEDYVEAIVESRLAQKEQAKQAQGFAKKVETIIKEAEKLGDFDPDDFREVPISKIMAEAIVESDVSAQLVKFFHDEPEEAERISQLSPARQAAAIGKLEDKLTSDKPKAVSKSAAPAPIKPVSGNGKSTAGYRPDMSQSEYVAWRRANR